MDKFIWVNVKKEQSSTIKKINIYTLIVLILFSVFQSLYIYLEKYMDYEFIQLLAFLTNAILSLFLIQGTLALIHNNLGNKSYLNLFKQIPWKKAILYQLIIDTPIYIFYSLLNIYNIIKVPELSSIIFVIILSYFLISLYFIYRLLFVPIIIWGDESFKHNINHSLQITKGKKFFSLVSKTIILPSILLILIYVIINLVFSLTIFGNIDRLILWGTQRFISHSVVYVLMGFYPKGIMCFYSYSKDKAQALDQFKRNK